MLRRLKLCPGLTAEIAAASLFASILALASPLFVIQVLNRYVAHGVDATLATLAVGAVIAIAMEFAFRQVRLRLAKAVSAAPNRNIANACFAILLRAKAAPLERIPPGQRQQIAAAAGAVEQAYGPGNIAAVFDVPFALLFVGVLFLLSPVLSGIVMLFLIAAFAAGAMGSLSQQGRTRELTQAGAAGSMIVDTASRQIDTVRAFGAAALLAKAWNAHLARVQGLRGGIEGNQGLLQSINQSTAALMGVGVVTAGAVLVVMGELDVGAMIGANILAARALMPISKVAQLAGTFAKATQSLELIGEFSKLPLEADSGAYKTEYLGGIEFKDVAFAYPGTSTPLFESLSLAVKPGTICVVTGANASGKTTLARLITGIIEPIRGQILADGLDLRQASPAWWRCQIVYLPQEPALLNATIRDNLLIANPDLGDEALGMAIQAAGLANFLDQSPRGLETQVTENGRNLSLGTRRRLALARALTTGGKLAVFDEPTEGLDAEGVACVYQAMKDLAQRGCTIIAISHDPKIVKGAHIAIDLNVKPVPRITERPRAVIGEPNASKTEKATS